MWTASRRRWPSDQGRDVLDGASPAGVDERGVEEQVRDRLGEPLGAQRLDLVLEPAGHTAHGRALDALAEERLGDGRDVPCRRATDVRLGDGVVDLRPPAEVPTQGPGRRAAGAGAPDADADLAGGGDHAAVVGAVADVDALIRPLVRPGADQALELLVQDDLDGALDRLPAPASEVEFEVFLRRDHELSSLVAKESF
jgi:hypothetical protein